LLNFQKSAKLNHTIHWQPKACFEHLKTRAKFLHAIREYFLIQDVLEVETPIASHFGVTDVYLENLSTSLSANIALESTSESVSETHSIPALSESVNSKLTNSTLLHLQTSPEFAMKRLLAAGSGSIYQICKAFRDDEIGRHHNPEFTMLEWYRLDYDHHQLMDDVVNLISFVANFAKLTMPTVQKKSYRTCFEETFGINPHKVDPVQISDLCQKYLPGLELDDSDKIQALFTLIIEPKFNSEQLIFIYDFPSEQASLARLTKSEDDYLVACRFECFCQNIELANGFYELSDPNEQQRRFEKDNKRRKALNKQTKPIDSRLIEALKTGLPDSAGVALGVDRLLMALTKTDNISEILSFDITNA
jgi:elongation factor P--(R)-beta-lysine ligase